MGALAKLKAGPFRRGRGKETDESRQQQEESVERDELLRGAIVELCASVEALEESGGDSAASASRMVALHSYCERGSSSTRFYAPFGTTAEAVAGAVDEEVFILPPFGTDSVIVGVHVLVEDGAGETTVTIREVNESVEASATIDDLTAGPVHVAPFSYAWSDGAPRIIGIDTASGPQSVVVMVLVEEGS